MTLLQTPPQLILEIAARFLGGDAVWSPLKGGRTNLAWRGRTAERDLVFKLYHAERSNPVFPNNPNAEWAALSIFAPETLAPVPVDLVETTHGICLVYEYVQGAVFEAASPSMAVALGRVHTHQTLRGPSESVGATRRLLKPSNATHAAGYGDDIRYLHGDPTPANALATDAGVCFLDWQCPRFGDPVDDLAVLLSPAMHVVYGTRVLTAPERDDVLRAYPDAGVAARYRALAVQLSHALVAYCDWKVAAGETAYLAAREAEVAYAKQMSD